MYSPTNKSSNSSKCVVSVGSLIPRKNFDLLIRAFSGVVDKVPDAVLKIYGDGSEKSNLIDLINSLNLNDNVQLKGFVENKYMPNIYKGASIFALIQHEESFGQVYLEAMASGLPIVTSKNIGSEQIIKPNFGTLVDLNDVNKCTRAIISLLKNDEKRNEFSTNARQEFEKKYDIQVSTLKYIKLYESLLAKH